jgi:hypothetical protein
MKKLVPALLSVSLFVLGMSVAISQAAEPKDAGAKAKVPPPPPIPDLPDMGGNEQDIHADVTIRKGKDEVVEEYRIHGQLYMVRVIPSVGKPYYLRYPEGANGRVIRRELDDIQTPYWKLFEWK